VNNSNNIIKHAQHMTKDSSNHAPLVEKLDFGASHCGLASVRREKFLEIANGKKPTQNDLGGKNRK
jgi:hypothetical protein